MAKKAVSAPDMKPELNRRKRNMNSSMKSGMEKVKSGRMMLEYTSSTWMKQ
jgi:hypothetical protein